MSPSTTDWMSAGGTIVAAVGTVATLGLLTAQYLRGEKAAATREKLSQAERVSGWFVGERPAGENDLVSDIALLNRSEEPVYEVVVSLVMIQGAGPRTGEQAPRQFRATLGVPPPGKYFASVAGGWAGMMRRAGVELAFTDRAGSHWVRRSDGSLSELETDPISHYRLDRPLELGTPRDVR